MSSYEFYNMTKKKVPTPNFNKSYIISLCFFFLSGELKNFKKSCFYSINKLI